MDLPFFYNLTLHLEFVLHHYQSFSSSLTNFSRYLQYLHFYLLLPYLPHLFSLLITFFYLLLPIFIFFFFKFATELLLLALIAYHHLGYHAMILFYKKLIIRLFATHLRMLAYFYSLVFLTHFSLLFSIIICCIVDLLFFNFLVLQFEGLYHQMGSI